MHLLNIVHGYNLVNVNDMHHNYPAVDLVDFGRKIAIQVTADTRTKSVKDRIDKFNRYNLGDQFETLYFYIIGNRSSSIKKNQLYPNSGDGHRVDLDLEVIDTKMLLKQIRGSGTEAEVLDYLESELAPKRRDEAKQTTINSFPDANLQGATLNVFHNAQNVMLDQGSAAGSDQHIVHIPAESYSNSGLISRRLEQPNMVLSEVISKMETGIQALPDYEVQNIHDELESISSRDFEEISNILWLLLYFEKTARSNPSLRDKRKAEEKAQSLTYHLPQKYIIAVQSFELHTSEARDLADLIVQVEA